MDLETLLDSDWFKNLFLYPIRELIVDFRNAFVFHKKQKRSITRGTLTFIALIIGCFLPYQLWPAFGAKTASIIADLGLSAIEGFLSVYAGAWFLSTPTAKLMDIGTKVFCYCIYGDTEYILNRKRAVLLANKSKCPVSEIEEKFNYLLTQLRGPKSIRGARDEDYIEIIEIFLYGPEDDALEEFYELQEELIIKKRLLEERRLNIIAEQERLEKLLQGSASPRLGSPSPENSFLLPKKKTNRSVEEIDQEQTKLTRKASTISKKLLEDLPDIHQSKITTASLAERKESLNTLVAALNKQEKQMKRRLVDLDTKISKNQPPTSTPTKPAPRL